MYFRPINLVGLYLKISSLEPNRNEAPDTGSTENQSVKAVGLSQLVGGRTGPRCSPVRFIFNKNLPIFHLPSVQPSYVVFTPDAYKIGIPT